MSYEQLKAGAAKFQLYFKVTNSLVPTTVVESGGRLVVQVIAPDNNIDVYYIDPFAGQQTTIALYTENNSARDYNLYDVTLDTTVHTVRGFRCENGTNFSYVFLEIDGKLYMPYLNGDQDQTAINWNDSEFEASGDMMFEGFSTLFPTVGVDIEENGGSLLIPSLGNISIASEDCIEITEAAEVFENKADGIISTQSGMLIIINGTMHVLTKDNTHGVVMNSGFADAGFAACDNDQEYINNVYDSRFNQIAAEGTFSETTRSIAEVKETLESGYGIQITGEPITLATIGADISAPWLVDE